MLGRRQFVKAGAGLAAIIAAGRAPAALIRSMLAARNGILVGGKLSAKSYVQDGLVAMWDGIENAGWGKHSDSPILRELVSGDTLESTGVFAVVPNGLETSGGTSFTGSATAIDLYTNLLGNVTFELLFTLKSLGGGHCRYFYFQSDGSHRYFDAYGTFANGTSYIDNGFQIRATSWNSIGAVVRNVTIGPGDIGSVFRLVGGVAAGSVFRWWYRNGSLFDSGSTTSGNLTGTPPNMYDIFATNGSMGVIWQSARLYSRALTADEVAHNYAVDKARFNLPT